VARGLPLRALGALLARARLFVGNDSGVSHLAAAYGTPALSLFGPTDPALWAPRGPRARFLQAPDGRMEGLALDVVEKAARELYSLGSEP
jgi:heptosyltransferase III